MDIKHKQKVYEKQINRISNTLIAVLLSIIAVMVGVQFGNLWYKLDVNLVDKIDPENFKAAINVSLPIIETVYNSGKSSVSLSGEIKDIFSRIFDFDLDSPATILNVQSPLFMRYYNKEYQSILAQGGDLQAPQERDTPSGDAVGDQKGGKSGATGDGAGKGTGKGTGDGAGGGTGNSDGNETGNPGTGTGSSDSDAGSNSDGDAGSNSDGGSNTNAGDGKSGIKIGGGNNSTDFADGKEGNTPGNAPDNVADGNGKGSGTGNKPGKASGDGTGGSEDGTSGAKDGTGGIGKGDGAPGTDSGKSEGSGNGSITGKGEGSASGKAGEGKAKTNTPGKTNEPQNSNIAGQPVSSIAFEEEEDEDEKDSDLVALDKLLIKNFTKHKIDIPKLLRDPLDIEFSKKGPKVLIYHTHTSESYVLKQSDLGKKNVPSFNSNPKYNVVRVGEELARNLEKYGIDTLHNGTVHDNPRPPAYGKSINTLQSYKKSYPSIKVFIDVHRDGLDEDQPKLRLTKEINGKKAAQIMFVVGADGTLPHPEWQENLKFVLKLQQRLNEKYPGLARPVWIVGKRYNQQISNQSILIEVGGDGNLLSECLESTKYLAEALNDVMMGK